MPSSHSSLVRRVPEGLYLSVASCAVCVNVFTVFTVLLEGHLCKLLFGYTGVLMLCGVQVMGPTTGIALRLGAADPMFAICLVFSMIVMYDASCFRLHAGKQVEVLNRVSPTHMQAYITGWHRGSPSIA